MKFEIGDMWAYSIFVVTMLWQFIMLWLGMIIGKWFYGRRKDEV